MRQLRIDVDGLSAAERRYLAEALLCAALEETRILFADLVGVDPITVSRWERGITKVSQAMVTHIRELVKEYKRNGR